MSREFHYRVVVDTEQVRGAARTMQQTFQQEMNRVQVQTGGATGGGAAGGSGGGISGSLLGGMSGALMGGLAGYASIQGVKMLATQANEMAKYSVELQRTSVAFELLSGSAEMADAKIMAVERASGGAIDRLTAMNIANRAAALGMADTAQELGRVTEFATVAGRVLGIDTAGALDNMALAASNLSFARLDQLGISSSQVRERFGELRGTMEDSKAFLQAMLEVGEATFSALNVGALTAASGQERLKVAIQNTKEELSGLGKIWNEFQIVIARDVLGDRTQDEETDRFAQRISQLNSQQSETLALGREDPGTQAQIEQLEQVIDLWGRISDSALDTVPNIQNARDGVLELGEAAMRAELSPALLNRMGTLETLTDRAAYAMIRLGIETANVGNTLSTLEPALSRVFDNQVFTFKEGAGWQNQGKPEGPSVMPKGYGDPVTLPSGWGVSDWSTAIKEGAKDKAALDRQAAKDATRAWSDAGRSTADAWKSAISGIGGLPGTGRTPVTQSQLDRAAAGLPQNFADDFLRRAEDELINGVDLPDIDRGFIEKLLGMEGKNLPNNVLFDILSEQSQSGEIFANPFARENYGTLVNEEAVGADLEKQGRIKEGLAFVDKQLKAKFGDLDFTSLGQTLSTGIATTFSDGTVDFAGETVGAMGASFTDKKNAAALTGLGVTMAENLFGGFTSEKGVMAQPWALAISTSVKNDIIKWLKEFMEGM